MGTEELFENKSKAGTSSSVIAWVFVLLVLALAMFAFVYFYYSLKNSTEPGAIAEREVKTFVPNFDDKKYSVKRESPVTLKANDYLSIAFSNKGYNYVPSELLLRLKDADMRSSMEGSVSLYSHDINPKGDLVFFATDNAKAAKEKQRADYLATLYLSHIKKDKNGIRFPSLGESRLILKANLYNKDFARISPDSNYALFNATDTNIERPYSSEKWGIYLVDLRSGKLRKITNGLYPQWVSNDKMLYMSGKDLWLYDLNSNQKESIWKVSGDLKLDNKFSVSDNLKRIAWSFPRGSMLVVLRLVDKANMIYKEESKIDFTSLHPALSPDGNKLATLSLVLQNGKKQAKLFTFALNDSGAKRIPNPADQKDIKDFAELKSFFIYDWFNFN